MRVALTPRCALQVRTAADGVEGLAALQASVGRAPGAPPPPSIVLTDMQMPRMGGIEMSRRYRQW